MMQLKSIGIKLKETLMTQKKKKKNCCSTSLHADTFTGAE